MTMTLGSMSCLTPTMQVLIGVLLVVGCSRVTNAGRFAAAAGPRKTFQTLLNEQMAAHFQSTLNSIDGHLRQLDNVYTVQLEVKMDQFHKHLSSLEGKINRLESVMQVTLENLSENISIRDGILKNDLFGKVDDVNDSIVKVLNNIDRKQDEVALESKEKLENIFNKLEQIEGEILNPNDADDKPELVNILTGVDELKTSLQEIGDHLINITTQNLNVTTGLVVALPHGAGIQFKNREPNVSAKLDENVYYIKDEIQKQIELVNETNRQISTMKDELRNDLNEYANKVADMNAELWEITDIMDNGLHHIEKTVNFTRADLQNTIRKLTTQLAKRLSKKNSTTNEYFGDDTLDELNQNLNMNFEKILSTQNLFLESCYRLQKDESQIETKIGNLLEKLTESFEKKTIVGAKEMRNLEVQLKGHEYRMKQHVTQCMKTTVDQNSKEDQKLAVDLARLKNHTTQILSRLSHNNISELSAYNDPFSNQKILEKTTVFTKAETMVFKDVMGGSNTYQILKSQINKPQSNEMKPLPMTANTSQSVITDPPHKTHQNNSVEAIDDLLEKIFNTPSTIDIDQAVDRERNNTEGKVHTISGKKNYTDPAIKDLVNEIFTTPSTVQGKQISSNPVISLNETGNVQHSNGKPKCKPNYLKVIDLRLGGDDCEPYTLEETTEDIPSEDFVANTEQKNNNEDDDDTIIIEDYATQSRRKSKNFNAGGLDQSVSSDSKKVQTGIVDLLTTDTGLKIVEHIPEVTTMHD